MCKSTRESYAVENNEWHMLKISTINEWAKRYIRKGISMKETSLSSSKRGGDRKSVLFVEDRAVPGNDVNRVSIKPLLKETLHKTLFAFILLHARV